MREKIYLFTLLWLSSFTFIAQENNDRIQFGYSNPGGLVYSSLSSDSSYFPQYFIQYHEKLDSLTSARFGISTNIASEKAGNIRYFYFIPCNLYIGVERYIIKNRITFTYGIDIFYSMSLRGSNLGNGSWRGDDFGLGISPITGLSYKINEKWSFCSELSIGGGFFRTYKNAGATTAKVLTPKLLFLKTLSIGLAYKIDPKK